MKPIVFPLLIVLVLTTLCCSPAYPAAAAGFVLKGRIVDAGGKPVEGGELFVYDSPRTKRPADFIAPMTDRQGMYRIEIPAGRYWVVARVRGGNKYGPLMPGGKHSGEAREIEATAGGEQVLDFTVSDVRDMARSQRKTTGGYRKVGGRILDRDGKPVPDAYAFARRDKNDKRLPDILSPWSDEEGRYSLYLPSGNCCLGASRVFPPEEGVSCIEMRIDTGEIDIANDIRLNYIGNKVEEANHNSKLSD